MLTDPARARGELEAGFGARRALVVGDLMLDRYLVGDVARISPEAPVPVVRLGEERAGVGGAGNVALNLAGLGLRVTLAAWTGVDTARTVLLDALGAHGVDTSGVVAVEGRPTTTKTRVLSRRHQLVRIDDEHTGALAGPARDAFAALVADLLGDGPDVVVLSDYAKGVLAGDLCRRVVSRARSRGIPVLVDPKGLHFERYARATTVTPNESELAAAAKVTPGDLDALLAAAGRLRAELDLEVLTLTRGEHGITLVEPDGVHHVPAHAREVFDVSGAGDTVIAVLAAGFAAGLSHRDAAALANIAAGVIVGKSGTVPVRRSELLDALGGQTRPVPAGLGEKIQLLPTLLSNVARWRAAGDVIGFTNGCFDLLHAGHVSYLDWARRHCDRLVVGLNTDASVRRQKGEGRPVTPQDARATVVAALAAVDAVVLFDEPTPLRLVHAFRPDVLVKGGDYAEEDVVGAPEVRGWGGKVLLAPLFGELSTSALVERARGTDSH